MVLHYGHMSQARLLRIDKVPASLRQQVLERLREAIISGHLTPGARLTERELTEQMGVSRTVLREALRQLEAEHLVEVIPNKGPVVRALSREEAEDLYRIRAVLHGLAARFCVENADVDDIGHLQAALTTVVDAYHSRDAEHVLDAKTGFYDVLYSGARSESLSAMLDTLQARIARWRALGLGHPERSEERSQESAGNLTAIVDAVTRRDADAAERLTREEDSQAGREVMRLLAIESTKQQTRVEAIGGESS